MILQTSSGSIRNVSSLSNVTRPGAASIFASTVRPITVPDGTVMVTYGTAKPLATADMIEIAGAPEIHQRLNSCRS
jgi:hypothetical protein